MSRLNPWRDVGKKIRDVQSTSDLSIGLLQQKMSEILMPQSLLGSRLNYLRKQMGFSIEEMRSGMDQILKSSSCGDLLHYSALSKTINGSRELSFLEGLAIAIILDVSVWSLAPAGLSEKRSKARKPSDLWVVHAVVGSTVVFRHMVFKGKIFTIASDPPLVVPSTPRPTLELVLEANPALSAEGWHESLEIGRYNRIFV